MYGEIAYWSKEKGQTAEVITAGSRGIANEEMMKAEMRYFMKKVEHSAYLLGIKPLLKELIAELEKEYAFVSVLASDSTARAYSVSGRGVSVSEPARLSERGFVVRVCDGSRCGEYSFNEITREGIPEIVQRVRNLAALRAALQDPLCRDIGETFSAHSCGIPDEEEVTLDRSTEYETAPWELSDEAILANLTQLCESAKAYDDRVLDASVGLVYQTYTKMYLSHKKDLIQSVMWTNGSLVVMASRGEEIKDYYKSYSALGGAELLEEMKKDAEDAAKVVIELLDAQQIEPGEYDCVCAPDVTGMIVHEAFGHGVEMDMFVKDRALAARFVGEYVASPLVTMHDGAAAAAQTATYFFDDEGTLAQDTIVIEKGILKGGICDSVAAGHLGVRPTGNGRRESYERKAYTRMTNTFFEGGTDRLEDMIASISHGYLLEDATSGMEDPKNWGIQCVVNIAREIKDGKLTGRIFSPIILTGYVPELLGSISMMSDTVVLSGTGFCGKGSKEWVKVSDGGPYMKARIRLG